MHVPELVARGSLRFSLGESTTQEDVDALVDAIVPVVERAKRAGLTSAPATPVPATLSPTP
jgi:cysteine desulfurase